MPTPSNPFVALLPARLHPGQPKSFGREDYITAALGVVLHADASAGGTLCRHVFTRLFEIDLKGPIAVSVQSEQKGAPRTCIIDLHVQTPTQLVFIENKTGAPLGVHVDPATQKPKGQLACYQEVLDRSEQFASSSRHLGMLTWAPPEPPDRRDYWAGAKYWWDLYEAVAEHDRSPNDVVARFRKDFLAMLEYVELHPTGSLTETTIHSPATVQRVLALALQRAMDRGAHFQNVRPASWGAYLVTTKDGDADGDLLEWAVGFWAGFPDVRCGKRGWLPVALPSAFLTQTFDFQVDWLAEHLWQRVARAEGIVRQTPRMSQETLLARCLGAAADVQALLEAAANAKWKPYLGGRELVLSTGPQSATWKIRLDTCNKGGANVRIEAPTSAAAEAFRGRLRESLGVGPERPVKGKMVDFRLATVPKERLHELPQLIDALRKVRQAA